MAPQAPAFDVLILAGGSARRLGGADKPMLEIGGGTLLDRVIEACATALGSADTGSVDANGVDANGVDADSADTGSVDRSSTEAARITVVGPASATRRPVRWTREDPPGGGPAAALAAGLTALTASPRDWVGVFAADLPFLDADTVHSLWTAIADAEPDSPGSPSPPDGAIIVDADGREQWLAAMYRRAALHARIARQPPDRIAGLPLRRLVQDLRLLRVAEAGQAVLDCDTWEDVAAARRIAAREADRDVDRQADRQVDRDVDREP